MRFFLFASAFVLACAGTGAAADLNPGAPIAPIPNFTLALPGFATWNGSIMAQNEPAGPVKCPITVMYRAKVTITPAGQNPVYGVVFYNWFPSKDLNGFYQLSNAQPGEAGVSAPMVVTMAVTYQASSPQQGSPITFVSTLPGGATPTKEELRVVSHVTCTNVHVLRQ